MFPHALLAEAVGPRARVDEARRTSRRGGTNKPHSKCRVQAPRCGEWSCVAPFDPSDRRKVVEVGGLEAAASTSARSVQSSETPEPCCRQWSEPASERRSKASWSAQNALEIEVHHLKTSFTERVKWQGFLNLGQTAKAASVVLTDERVVFAQRGRTGFHADLAVLEAGEEDRFDAEPLAKWAMLCITPTSSFS